MGDRNYNFPIPKNELYYYDTVEGAYKPLILEDGLIPVKLGGVDAESGALPTSLTNSEIMQPIEVQGHLQTTIQTHAGVIVTPNGSNSNSAWIDTAGFDRVAITYINDANTNNSTDILWSHDGINTNSIEWVVLNTSTIKERAVEVPTKARYMKIRLNNGDTSAPHTMSAWAYLKA
jgi:hypothetical protein